MTKSTMSFESFEKNEFREFQKPHIWHPHADSIDLVSELLFRFEYKGFQSSLILSLSANKNWLRIINLNFSWPFKTKAIRSDLAYYSLIHSIGVIRLGVSFKKICSGVVLLLNLGNPTFITKVSQLNVIGVAIESRK